MKSRLWVFQLPIVVVACLAYWIVDQAGSGGLSQRFLRSVLYPPLARVNSVTTDLKFKLRGPRPVRNRVVIVEIDNWSLEDYGRWPWHRDLLARLVERVFDAGARAVGLDIILAEPDPRVPQPLVDELSRRGLSELARSSETDPAFMRLLEKHGDRIVMAWGTESPCQPAYSDSAQCPVLHPDALAGHPKGDEGLGRFGFSKVTGLEALHPEQTPLLSLVTLIPTYGPFAKRARHQGFLNVQPEADGYVRRSSLLMLAAGQPYPSLALEVARTATGGAPLTLELDKRGLVERIALGERAIPTTALGAVEINFRGPGHTFDYVSAHEVLDGVAVLEDPLNLKLRGKRLREVLADSVVLIGLSAMGAYDMRSFPFAANIPGVDGHAQILDNLLSGDPLQPSSGSLGAWIWLLVMSVGAMGFARAVQRVDAVPGLGLFIGVLVLSVLLDVGLLFGRLNRNYATGYYYLELLALFGATLAGKYIREERSKKFIRTAFSKYVAPVVVDSILRDPGKLTLGGERRELTVLFSDIRQFTTFSEKMDPRALSGFLNDYLGVMTNIVFEHQGTLDKYIGDAVMAFWGAPLRQDDHAARALSAASAMQAALREHRPRFLNQYGIDVRVGVGVNSGLISVGNMGSERSFGYTVIGDQVNLASRLEGLTKHYQVEALTTRATLESVVRGGGELPPHRVLDFVKVKGKTQSVELVELLSGREAAGALEAFEQARSWYLAREFERAGQSFTRLAQAGPGPAELFASRCEHWRAHPPSPDWGGEWVMEDK